MSNRLSFTFRATRAMSTSTRSKNASRSISTAAVPLLDHQPGDLDRIMGAPARAEPIRNRHKPRIKHRGQHLRDGLLNQPIQHRRNSQLPLPAIRFGNHHLTHRRRTVRTRIQRRPRRRPMFTAPVTQLSKGHTIHTGRTPIAFDTSQRNSQVLRGEHLIPQPLAAPDVSQHPPDHHYAQTAALPDSPVPPFPLPHIPWVGCDHRHRHE